LEPAETKGIELLCPQCLLAPPFLSLPAEHFPPPWVAWRRDYYTPGCPLLPLVLLLESQLCLFFFSGHDLKFPFPVVIQGCLSPSPFFLSGRHYFSPPFFLVRSKTIPPRPFFFFILHLLKAPYFPLSFHAWAHLLFPIFPNLRVCKKTLVVA